MRLASADDLICCAAVDLGWFIVSVPGGCGGPVPPHGEKKADVVEHPEAFHHVGLLVNGPPGMAGLPLI